MTARNGRGPKTTGLMAMAVAGGLLACQTPGGPAALNAQERAGTEHDGPAPGVLHVTGNGLVEVQPDRARLSFAVETEAEDAVQATFLVVLERVARLRELDDMRFRGHALQPEPRAQQHLDPGQR